MRGETEHAVRHREAPELDATVFEVAVAPAHELEPRPARDVLRERGGLQARPKIGRLGGEEREVGLRVPPLHAGVEPAAATALLQPDQGVGRQVLRGGQDLVGSDHEAVLANGPCGIVPGLEGVVELVGHLDVDQRARPVGRGRRLGPDHARGGDAQERHGEKTRDKEEEGAKTEDHGKGWGHRRWSETMP